QLGRLDRLGHVAPRARPDHRDHVLRRVGGRQRQEPHLGEPLPDGGDHGLATAARQVHVEQDDIGSHLGDQVNGRGHVIGRADHARRAAKFRRPPGPDQPVIVHEPHARHGLAHGALRTTGRGIFSDTLVPSPTAVCTATVPPCLLIRPWIDSAIPLRSAGTADGSKPFPRSRTTTSTSSAVASAYSETTLAPDPLAAFTTPSRAASRSACRSSSSGQSATVTTSTGTPCRASTSCWILRTASATVATSPTIPGVRPSNSQDRSSRSCTRASFTTSVGSSARR